MTRVRKVQRDGMRGVDDAVAKQLSQARLSYNSRGTFQKMKGEQPPSSSPNNPAVDLIKTMKWNNG